jgi:hypothetical protein
MADDAAAALSRGFDALDPALRVALAPMLRSWVTATRDTALEQDAQTIPAAIRRALIEHVDADVLDAVRWQIDTSFVSLQRAVFGLGYAPAMTVDHVLIFRDSDAAADPMLWAHELAHVMQFRRWGIDGFVERYLADYQAVETEATEFHWRWMKETGRVPGLSE